MTKCGELNCDHQCEDGIIYCACHQYEMKDCIAKQVEEAYARGVKERVEGQREIIENFKQQHGLMSEAEWVKYHSDKLITDIRDGRTKLYTEEQKQQAVEKALAELIVRVATELRTEREIKNSVKEKLQKEKKEKGRHGALINISPILEYIDALYFAESVVRRHAVIKKKEGE